MIELEIEEDYSELDYWSNMSKAEQDREMARRTLIRMFPALDEEELIQLEEGKLMRFTVNRVLERMLHDGCPAFSMDQTFDIEVFYAAKDEAYDLELWVESEEDTPMPASLKWKPVSSNSEVSDEETEASSEVTTTTRKTRGISPNSKYQKCLVLVKEHLESGTTRQDSIHLIVEQFGLNRATAESYYSKAKASIEKATA